MTTRRFEAFNDGVFAIVITLLVLDLRGPVEGQSIAAALADERYAIAAYVVAFFGVGVLWLNHHAVFHDVGVLRRSAVFADLVLLLFVTATPYTAGLFADGLQRGGFDANAGAAVFSAVFAGVAATFAVVWWLVSRDAVRSGTLDPADARRSVRRFGVGVLPYLALIGLSFVSPIAVLVCHFALGLFYAFDQLGTTRGAADATT